MKNITLFVGCEGVAQIKNDEFLILKNYDDVGMTETDLNGFKQHLEKYKNVCTTTWSQELKEDYNQICSEVGL